MKKIFLLILLFNLFRTFCFSQNRNKFDSLQTQYKLCKADTQKVIYLRKIAYAYTEISEMGKAFEYANKALVLALTTKNRYHIYRSYLALGLFSNSIGKIADALNYYTKGLSYLDIEKNKKDETTFMYVKIGQLYNELENYKKSYEYYDKAVLLAKQDKDTLIELQVLLSKIKVLVNDNKFADANKIVNHIDSLGNLKYKDWNSNKKLFILQEQWLIEYNQKHYETANKIGLQSLSLAEKAKDKGFVVSSNYLIAKSYYKLKDYEKAKKYIDNVIKGDIEFNDINGLMEHYNLLSELLIKEKKYSTAKELLLKALKIANEGKIINLEIELLKNLSEVTEKLNDPAQSLLYFKQAVLLKDSLTNNKSQNIISEIQTRTETEQAQKEIEILNKDKVIKDTQFEKEKTLRYALFGGLALMILLAGISYRNYKRKQKDNLIINKQKHLVEEKNREILDSIEYALRIQTAILPPQKIVRQYLEKSFILYKPKDIVAGDFYWMEQINDLVLFAACDCTGHGVPGAMVSVVCHNALNRAVREFGLTQPAAILDKTAEIVLENFSKSEDEIHDGMDISICALNTKTRLLEWAGANNPIWLISNGILIETKADKQCIGHNDNIKPFTNHKFKMESDTSIYLFSDGFADQFGGQPERKLTKNRFKELLLSIQQLTIQQQALELDKFITNYKKEIEQTDDILVIGVKV